MDCRVRHSHPPDASFAVCKFFLRFCAVAWAYQWYRNAKEKITIAYDNCYFECQTAQKQWDEFRRDYCDDCPHKNAREKLWTDTQAIFKERFDEEIDRVRYSKLLELVKQVAAFDGTTENIGVKHSHLLTGYLKEKDKFERQRKANRPTG